MADKRHMLIRHKYTLRPVVYSTVPVPDEITQLIEAFGDLTDCEVKVVESTGERKDLAAHFKTLEGWRNAKV